MKATIQKLSERTESGKRYLVGEIVFEAPKFGDDQRGDRLACPKDAEIRHLEQREVNVSPAVPPAPAPAPKPAAATPAAPAAPATPAA